ASLRCRQLVSWNERVPAAGLRLARHRLWRVYRQRHPRRHALGAARTTGGRPRLRHEHEPGAVAHPHSPDVGLCTARPLQLLDAADQVDGAAVAAADRRHRPLGGPARRAELHPYRRTGASGLALAVLPRAVGLLHPADVLLRKGVRGAHALGRSRHPGGGPLMDLLDPLLTDLQLLAKPSLFNVYFAVASIPAGFLFAIFMALGKASPNPLLARLCRGYIYAFRGSP